MKLAPPPFLHAVVAALALASGCRRASTDPTPPDDPSPNDAPAVDTDTTGSGRDAGPAVDGSEDRLHAGPEIHAADLAHVDPVELLQQARAVAEGYDPHAVLVSISAHGDVTAGTVDVTAAPGITYAYEWHYFDKTRPPGKDKVENGLWIFARWGHFSVMELHRAHALSASHRADPGQSPRCPARDAWSAAVRGGMPQNAVASLDYDPRSDAWTFRVDGHGELTRVVSGATCTSGGHTAPAPRSPAGNPNSCGCADGDLMCAMRCGRK
jgi:hypothetical protein